MDEDDYADDVFEEASVFDAPKLHNNSFCHNTYEMDDFDEESMHITKEKGKTPFGVANSNGNAGNRPNPPLMMHLAASSMSIGEEEMHVNDGACTPLWKTIRLVEFNTGTERSGFSDATGPW